MTLGSKLRKADKVADDLLRRIVAGELEVGAILPRENELAGEYDVNRGVVREAVKLLEVHRLVRPRRRRGTEVLDPMASLSPEVLRAMLEPRPGQVDPAVLADLLELRAQLDEQMTQLAALRRTDEDLLRFEATLVELQRAVAAGDDEGYFREMNRFALCTARATQNRIYPMLVHWHGRIVVDLLVLFREVRRPSEQHAQGMALLVELIRNQDAEGATALVRAYHAYATPHLLAVAARTQSKEEDDS